MATATAKQIQTPTETERVLIEMLKEDTGRHMLDSGGTYGRNWESNEGKDFLAEDAAELSFKWESIGLTFNIFHWLGERLEYNKELDEQFLNFAATGENEHTPWLPLMEQFVEEEIDDAAGIHGEGNPTTCNSYNSENLLSQTIQFVYWTDEDGPHILLQIHGGCDVRGGYTRARAFDLEEYEIFSFSDGSIWCSNKEDCGLHWYTDDAYHWYAEMAVGSCEGRQLETYDLVDHDKVDYTDDSGMLIVKPKKGRGYVFVDEDGNGHCPCCGGKLVT